jgi:hypothetical protein
MIEEHSQGLFAPVCQAVILSGAKNLALDFSADKQHDEMLRSPRRRFYFRNDGSIFSHAYPYYDILEQTQKGGMDITPWMAWFLGCLGCAIDGAQGILGTLLAKARFWESVRDSGLNERQRLLLDRLLDGLEGKLTTSKWAKLAKCSHDTALRDITALVKGGILVRNSQGGRSTSYALAKTVESSSNEKSQ